MDTKNISQELEKAIKSLIAEGKEPSVALVKARLPFTVPMPAIISTIKVWQKSNKVPKVEIAADKPLSTEQRIEQLEQQVTQLMQRVRQLEQN